MWHRCVAIAAHIHDGGCWEDAMKSALTIPRVVRCAALSLVMMGSVTSAQLQLPNLSGLSLGGEQSRNGPAGGSASGGGLSGVLGGLMPNVGSVAAPNAAGILGYCLKNKFLGSGGAASVLGQLTGRPGTRTAPGYTAGRQGVLQMEGTSLPLGSLKSQLTSRVCDMVLKHAQSLL
jgi:hypothetical protein